MVPRGTMAYECLTLRKGRRWKEGPKRVDGYTSSLNSLQMAETKAKRSRHAMGRR
jgi:hypothetical protein